MGVCIFICLLKTVNIGLFLCITVIISFCIVWISYLYHCCRRRHTGNGVNQTQLYHILCHILMAANTRSTPVSNLWNWLDVTFIYSVFFVQVPIFTAKHLQSFREALHGTLVQEQMLVILVGAAILCVVAGNPL